LLPWCREHICGFPASRQEEAAVLRGGLLNFEISFEEPINGLLRLGGCGENRPSIIAQPFSQD